MSHQIIRKAVSDLKHGTNIRSNLGSEADLARHGNSVSKRQVKPLLILPDGTVIDGNRTLAAARLVGIEELDCVAVEEDITPGEYRQIQWMSAVHRQDISAYDKAAAIRDTKADFPGMANKHLADDVLNIDPALVTKNLALFDCLPEVQEAARADKLGLSDWYAISRSPDQAAALADALNGSSRDELERAGRKQRNGNPATSAGQAPAVRMPRIKIPLANDIATGAVTVAGEAIDLEDAETLLKEAIKAVRAARDKNLDTKTAQSVWRDMAKAGS